VFAQLAHDGEAVLAGQAQVEQHQRWRVGLHRAHQRVAVVQLRDAVALCL
jgi:hypothetical protein